VRAASASRTSSVSGRDAGIEPFSLANMRYWRLGQPERVTRPRRPAMRRTCHRRSRSQRAVLTARSRPSATRKHISDNRQVWRRRHFGSSKKPTSMRASPGGLVLLPDDASRQGRPDHHPCSRCTISAVDNEAAERRSFPAEVRTARRHDGVGGGRERRGQLEGGAH
jgi:uncharacterized protein YcbX